MLGGREGTPKFTSLPVGHIEKEGASLPGQLGAKKRVEVVDEHISVCGAHTTELGQKLRVQVCTLHRVLDRLPTQHTRLRRRITEFSREFVAHKRVNKFKIT